MFNPVRRQLNGDWHSRGLLLGAIFAALLSAHCGDAGHDAGQGGSGGEATVDPAICRPPASVSGAPQTIDDVTALINALVKEHDGKLELPCFIASLDRPLGATASAGFVSAQPAHGARSPRIFLWSGALVLSVAPEGIGKDLLELGYQTTPTRSSNVFESDVLRPSDSDLVAIGNVEVESKQCDPAAEPQRCALLAAIFDEGNLVPKGFSQAAKTLYGE